MSEENIDLNFLRQVERKWQRIWKERRVYEPDIDRSKKKFFLTVPYPYTSGPLHIGHGRTYVLGDIIARFKRLFGFNVLFPMAFHVTGMPILAISDRIKRGEEKVLKQYREYIGYYVDDPKEIEKILSSFVDPINVAVFFANNIQRDFEALGLGIDWRRKFHTAERIYNKFVEWQYYKLKEKGLIVRGSHYVRYCLLHKQSVGEDDIADGDVNPVYIQEFVAIKFKFDDGYILAATLRPETLYGATNLWVNPNAKYLKIRVNGEIWYLSKEAYVKLKHQYLWKMEVLEELSGREFIGKEVISPLGDKLVILPAEFVDPDRATGFVYSELADAPYDYVALQDLKKNPEILREYGLDPKILEKIVPKKIIRMPGITGIPTEEYLRRKPVVSQLDKRLDELTEELYKEQFYKGVMMDNLPDIGGLPVREARDIIKQKLLDEDNAIIFYETSRKAVCRGGGKIIVARIEDQWFIDYSKEWWKKKSKAWLEKMLIYPSKYKKLFEDTIDWLALRPCARGRGLGTKLPFDKNWVIESLSDSTIYMAFYTIAHLIRKYVSDPEKLAPEVFDYIFLGKGDPEELEQKYGISKEILESMRENFEYWYPNDQRHTATPHITNHLTFFIMHHVAIFPEKYWPPAITLNGLVIREGKKMSKSKGNVVPLVDIAKKYSADLFRLYIAGGADFDGTVDWKEQEVRNLQKSLLTFTKYVLKAANYINRQDIEVNLDGVDGWLISRFYSRLADSREKAENFRIRDYVVALFYEMMNDISRYLKRVGDKDKLYRVLSIFLRDWIISLSPIIPHIAEEVWSKIKNGRDPWTINFVEYPKAKRELINEKIEILEEVIDNVVSLGRELISLLKRQFDQAKIVIASEWKFKLFKLVGQAIGEGIRDFSRIMKVVMTDEELRKHSREIPAIIKKILAGKMLLPREIIDREEILEYLRRNVEYLKRELGVNRIEIITEEDAGSYSAAKRSLPLKPVVIFES